MRTVKKADYKGPDESTVAEWKNLTYKPFHKEVAQYSGFTGFYSDVDGKNLFVALIQYLGQNYP